MHCCVTHWVLQSANEQHSKELALNFQSETQRWWGWNVRLTTSQCFSATLSVSGITIFVFLWVCARTCVCVCVCVCVCFILHQYHAEELGHLMLKTTVRLQELQEQHDPVLPVHVCFSVYYCVAIGIIYYFCQGRQGNLYSSLISNCLGVFYMWGQRYMDPTQLSPVSKGLNIKSSVPARTILDLYCVKH